MVNDVIRVGIMGMITARSAAQGGGKAAQAAGDDGDEDDGGGDDEDAALGPEEGEAVEEPGPQSRPGRRHRDGVVVVAVMGVMMEWGGCGLAARACCYYHCWAIGIMVSVGR